MVVCYNKAMRKDDLLYIITAFSLLTFLFAGVQYFKLVSIERKIDKTSLTQKNTVDFLKIESEKEPFIGREDAPLTIGYWFDYQCPFCKKFDLEALPQIITDYVETGKVKVVFKDLAFLGPDSQTASIFANAIWELYPDKFFEWHKAMMEAQDRENGGFGDRESIVNLIKEKFPSMDAERITQLVDQKKGEYEKEIQGDIQEAVELGINSTPTVVIGEEIIRGALPYPKFKKAIDKALSQLGETNEASQ